MRVTPSSDDAILLKQIGRQYPQLVDVLSRLRAAEMETMALTTVEQFSTYKGRVQGLTELRQLISPLTP
jgi:hypothetical protein